MREAPNLWPQHADLIGRPFAWGGRGPDTFDCYGLVSFLLARAGVQAPDYTSPTVQEQIAQLIDGTKAQLWEPCESGPGAVVTFRIGRHVAHVGLVLPYGRFIHCWEHSGGVCIERLDVWSRRVAGFYRVPQ